MSVFLLTTVIISEISATLAVCVSIRYPAQRIWPPDLSSPWKKYLMGFLFLYPALGIGVLGIMDWGNLHVNNWIRFVSGIPLLTGGFILFLWAFAYLGFRPTFGNGTSLVTGGPFCVSRNPQYVGCILMLLGWTLLASSQAAAVASVFGVPPLILVPFAEEPWLVQVFGAEYEAYRKAVPRFLSLRKRG